jgi:hypothetical protein
VLRTHGSEQHPFPDRPAVNAVEIQTVREEFDKRYAIDSGADRTKELDKRRKAFTDSMNTARDRAVIEIREINGVPFVWLTNPEIPVRSYQAEPERKTEAPL